MENNLQEEYTFQDIEQLKSRLPDEEYLYDLAELFKVFGDSTRIRILYALFESDLCVTDLVNILSVSQSAVSHQLKILKDAKLVKFRRDGKNIFADPADSLYICGADHCCQAPKENFATLKSYVRKDQENGGNRRSI